MPLFRGTRDKGDVKKQQVFHHGEFSMVEIHGWKYGKKEKNTGSFPAAFFGAMKNIWFKKSVA